MAFENFKRILKKTIEDRSGLIKEISAIPFLILGILSLSVVFMVIGDIEPVRMQNFLLITFGSFAAYVYLMRIYFDDQIERNMKQRSHLGYVFILALPWLIPSFLLLLIASFTGGEIDYKIMTFNGFTSLGVLYLMLCLLSLLLFPIYLGVIDKLKEDQNKMEEE